MRSDRAYVELNFRPGLDLVSPVRRFVTSVYEGLLVRREEASRIGVASHELLENAVRCSIDGVVVIRIEVEVGGRGEDVIVTTNRAHPRDIEAIRGLIDSMNAAADPLVHYTALMRQNARRTDGSGLGLARVRAECDLDLVLSIEGDLVTVRACGRVTGAEAS